MKKTLLALSLLALGASAQAATVFSDNFNSDPLALHTTSVSGWSVASGYVDVLGLLGNRYIDLDGGTLRQPDAGSFSHTLNLSAGSYTISFDLGHTSLAPQDVAFALRNATTTLVNSVFSVTGIGWTHETLSFNVGSSGSYTFSFLDQNPGANLLHAGPRLDNVTVASVPEPETYAMLLAGLGMVGFMARRRSRA